MNDRWGTDRNTGARGLERGHRVVKNGMVKIGGDWWRAVRGSLEKYEGRKIEVSCADAWASRYDAIDADSLDKIADLRPAGKQESARSA